MSNHGKVIYNTFDEYKVLCDQFKNDLPQLIHVNRIDDWTYANYSNVRNTNFGIQFSNRFENALVLALSKLTKDKIPYWVKNTAEILGNAIRGLAKSVSRMKNIRHSIVSCSDCGQDEVVEVQEGFEDHIICNILIEGMINNVLFDTEGEEMGSAMYSVASLIEEEGIQVFNKQSGRENPTGSCRENEQCGMLRKACLFKCETCSNLVDEIFVGELGNICLDCDC